jgi:hypothetical protein
MSAVSAVTSVIKASSYLASYVSESFWRKLTFSRRVDKTRKAFEERLIEQGLSREDAKRLSACFEDLKGDITGMLRQGMRLGGN